MITTLLFVQGGCLAIVVCMTRPADTCRPMTAVATFSYCERAHPCEDSVGLVMEKNGIDDDRNPY